MAEGDIDLGAFLDKYSPTPKPEAELPEVKATRQTYYYPATPEATRAAGLSYGMEGGIHGGPGFSEVDLREHTLEKFKEGKSPYVAVAMAGKPTGELFRSIVEGTPIIGKWVDTGGGLAPGQQDIATSNPDLARGGGTGGGGAPEYPGISPMMQIAMEKSAAQPEEPEKEKARASSAGISPTPVPDFIKPVVMPQVQPIETPPIQTGIGQAIQQTPIPQPQQQDIDLGAFLAARQTPTPQPTETPAPAAQDIDLGQFLASRVSPQELPQAAGVVAPQAGFMEGLNLATVPRDVAMSFLPFAEAPHAISQAAQVISGVPIEQAIPESQKFVGIEKKPLRERLETGLDTAIQMLFAREMSKGMAPKAKAGPGLKAPPAGKAAPGGRQVAAAKPAAAEPVAEVPVGAYGTAKVSPGIAKFIRDHGYGRSHLNQFLIDAYKAADKGDQAGVNKNIGFLRDDLRQMRVGDYQDHVQEIKDYFDYDFKKTQGKAAEVQATKTKPDIVSTVSGREAVAKPAAAEPPTTPPRSEPPSEPMPEPLNPVPGSGKFRRSYRVDKELGDRMEGIGASRESGALRAEVQSRNMLHELNAAQEADLGRYLVSRRLKTLNPDHPQILPESEMTRIENDPAIKKALDYYKEEVKPEVEGLRKRAGLTEEAAAGKEPEFISLIVKNPEPLPPARGVGLAGAVRLPRKTRFAQQALGMAREYSTNLREILSESYGEVMRKMRVREFYEATKAKGITEKGTYDELPPELQHDLTAATQPELNRLPIQNNPNFGIGVKLGDLARLAGRGYQKMVTGIALTVNPGELFNHMRRQLNLVAAKPPVGMGVLARLEALIPYFGPKLGAFKRVVMEDMSLPRNKEILQEIFDAGGGSSRSFGHRYESRIQGLKQIQHKTQNLLFGIPKGRGVNGWDLRMRVQLEKIRRSAEGNKDPQRMREFANQIGQYGSHPSWFVRGLRTINPYAATTAPMRLTELRTAFGGSGLKAGAGKALLYRAETLLRGTGGTLLALATANWLLSGKWPWENDSGHEFDMNTGVKNKDGKSIYLKLRAIAPELSRVVGTLSLPDLFRERTAKHPQYVSASMTGPANQAASLVSGPGQNFALTAVTGKVPYFLKRPGEGPELMDVAQLKKGESKAGVSRGLRQLKAAAQGINPLGGIFGSQFNVEVPDALGYIEEPVIGVKPFGDIYSTSYEKKKGSKGTPVYIGR